MSEDLKEGKGFTRADPMGRRTKQMIADNVSSFLFHGSRRDNKRTHEVNLIYDFPRCTEALSTRIKSGSDADHTQLCFRT